MLAVRSQINILVIVLVTLAMSHILSAQSASEQEKRGVPTEVRTRLDVYYELLQKENWEKLYEIENWPNRDRKAYISTHIRFKGNTYNTVTKLLLVGLSDSMTYFPHSKKWQIEGCGKFKYENEIEITASGTVDVVNDPKRGWIVLSYIPTLYADGWRQCKTSIDEFPIKILDK
jgi:hypothetical protein